MANIGDLVVQIDANTSGLEAGLDRATKATGRYRDAAGRMREANGRFVSSASAAGGAIEQTGKQAATASSAFGTLRARLVQVSGLLATIGIGIGLTQSVRQVADFQTALNGLAAVSGATQQEMETLESQARTLGATSRFSAQQAAEGQRFLAQAGFSVNETLGATPGILQLATAAELDLGTAADIASNVLGGMRLEVDQLNRVNDVLAATASRSNTSISQLGQALSFAAPFAAGAGISIEEAAAAIGNMSDAGIQASRAGTGLVGTIRQLSNVTDAGEDVLGRYGLSVADVNIEARGLGPVLETLRAANLSTADAIALFGSEAGAAAQVLVNDYNGAIEDAAGEAERMAGIMEQGLTPAFRSLGSAISESVLQMGDSGLAGALEGLVRGATGVISVWNGMGQEWAEANGVGQEQLETIELTATAIEGLVATLVGGGGAVAALAALTGGARAAKGAVVALNIAVRANPLIAFVSILGAAAGAIYTFRKELGLVAPEAKTVAEELAEVTTSIEGMDEAMLDLQVAAFGAEMLQMNIRAKELKEELEELQETATNDRAGAGQRLRAQMGVSQSERELASIESRREAISQAMDGLDRFRTASEEAASGSDKLTESTNNAASALDKFSASMSPEVESILDRAGPGATIDENGMIRDAFGNFNRVLQRELDSEIKDQINEFSAEKNLNRGLEAAAQRFIDGAGEAVSKAWSSVSVGGKGGIMPTGEQSSVPALAGAAQSASTAMLGSNSGPGKNLGTLKLASEKGGSIDVQANSDKLTSWLADTLSGNAAAS